MACGGPLSPVSMIAGAGLLSNVGLAAPAALTGTIGNFTSLPITSQFSGIVSGASGLVSGGTLDSLRTLGADTFPALTNAIPGAGLLSGDIASALNVVAPGGMADGGLTGLVGTMTNGILGGGDLSQFSQVFSAAQGYAGIANQFLNSTQNIAGLASTFGPLTGGMDSLMTGSFSQVSEAFGSLGGDLGNLGNLIDMNNLPNLGDPSALVKQLSNVGGLVPGVESALRSAGLDSSAISGLALGDISSIPASANKLLYEGMTKITGSELTQIKSVLGVTTPNINSMADLLNPAKILPNSFPSLTVPTPDGLRGIYADLSGTVNTNIEKFLQDPKAPAYTGDDPIVRA